MRLASAGWAVAFRRGAITMPGMKIVVDSNIPYAREALGGVAEVVVPKANELSPQELRDCDVLLCRSTRKVDASLLDGTAVRFVATATIGFDHVDLEYLQRRGIGFASAPGSNANSVSEYLTSAHFVLAEEQGRRLREMSIGVVGVGNVGSRVAAKAEALGMTVLRNDPPLRRKTGDERFRPLGELMDCDVITFHVPLVKEGEDPTYHMASAELLARLRGLPVAAAGVLVARSLVAVRHRAAPVRIVLPVPVADVRAVEVVVAVDVDVDVVPS